MQLGHIHINTERVETNLGDESIVGNLHNEPEGLRATTYKRLSLSIYTHIYIGRHIVAERVETDLGHESIVGNLKYIYLYIYIYIYIFDFILKCL